MIDKKTIAVMFGGNSAEHDVSILTAIQIIEAMDREKYDVLPVYVAQNGKWYVGEKLCDRRLYPMTDEKAKKFEQVIFPFGEMKENEFYFKTKKKSFFSKSSKHNFDAVIPAFHGTKGEDGAFQGLLEVANVPYAGYRVLGASVCMDKAFSKNIFKFHDIPVLNCHIIKRPQGKDFIDTKKLIEGKKIDYPVCAKPQNLGSSIGVHRADDDTSLQSALLEIFKLDNSVVVEPFVNNLVEYNVAVTSSFGKTIVSAIEKPARKEALLDFSDKYLAGGDVATKLSVGSNEGMGDASRELNPKELTKEQVEIIRKNAIKAFEIVGGRGCARVDFLCDEKTGEIWLNEVNSFPGSLSYFLWEAREEKVSFTELLDAMIEEAFLEQKLSQREISPKEAKSSVFKS